MPSGWRNVGVFLVQCMGQQGQTLEGRIVEIIAMDPVPYRGPYRSVTPDGRFEVYTGQAFSGLCSPCANQGPVLGPSKICVLGFCSK